MGIVTFIFIGCKSQNINDKSKRNANWVWWIDANTRKGEWVPVGDTTTAKNGRYTAFYANGNIYSEGNLINGKEADTINWYNIQGQLDCYHIIKPDTIYDYFITDGPRKSYYCDGALSGEGSIKNHEFYGKWTHYNSIGNKEYVRNFIKDSAWKLVYYENGQKQDSSFIFDGIAFSVCKKWYENGQVEEENNFVNGLQDCIKTEYYERDDRSTSSVKTRSTWKKGVEDGLQLDYYKNGQLKDSAYIIEKTPRDIVKYWREDGSIELMATLKNGVLVNRKEYNNSGMLVRDTTIQ